MISLTKRENQVLFELLKNGRISDQELARKISTSRPNVAKIRSRLEEKGVIKGYSAKVDIKKLGLHIHAITMFRWDDYSKIEDLKKSMKFLIDNPKTIMAIKGVGIGSKTKAAISFHDNLSDYEDYNRGLQRQWAQNVHDVEVFLSSLDSIHKEYDPDSPVLHKIKENLKKFR